MIETKRCTKCGIKKPITEFTKHPKCKDGHINQCKRCVALHVRDEKIKRGWCGKPRKSIENLGNNSNKSDYLYKPIVKYAKPRETKFPQSLCNILQRHSNDLKDDPQKLSSDFLAEILFCHEERYYIKYLKTKTFTNNL